MPLKLIDLFCGAGGFTRGFVEEGFTPVLAIDNDLDCVATYTTNFPQAIVLGMDIRRINGLDLIDIIGDDVDVVIASPPCEAFTTISRNIMEDPIDRLYTDPRGRLTLKAIELIGDLKPKAFVIENVPGILVKPIPRFIEKELGRVGYTKIYFNLLKAEDHRTPSVRRRVFISNIKIKPRKSRRNVKVWDAIGDLPDPRYPNEVENHFYVPLPHRFRKKVAKVRWGGALDYYLGGNWREYKQYIRLHPDKLAPVIMGKSRFIHPYDNRQITIREQARLMGYPDKHVFRGGVEKMYNQVGESVPPTLANAIAKVVKKHISETIITK